MNNKGFTLVELLAVIVLLGLIMTIAIPSAFKLSSKVKAKAYLTKIELIEESASNYGQTNVGLIRKGTLANSPANYLCTFEYIDDDIENVSYNQIEYSETRTLLNTANKKEYWCTRVTVLDLVKAGELNYDETDVCQGRCDTEEKKINYDNIVINSASNDIINKCYVYIYYRNSRVYSYFDKATCDVLTDTPTNGHQYSQLKK